MSNIDVNDLDDCEPEELLARLYDQLLEENAKLRETINKIKQQCEVWE